MKFALFATRRPLLWVIVFSLLVLAGKAHAASFAITAVRVNGTTTATTSTCHTASACNGWVAELDMSSSVAAGGSYSLGLAQSSNNTPSAAKIVFKVTSSGFTNAGGTTTLVRTVYGTRQLRQFYNNANLNDETNAAGVMTLRIALSDVIYSSDTVTVSVAAGIYTDGSANTNSALSAGTAVTNNSTLGYVVGRVVANWSRPGWQRITGSSFNLYAVAFQRHAMNGLPVACVVFTVTDQHAHTVSQTVTVPTIDIAAPDPAKVIEYIAKISTASFTQSDKLTANFKAYPWVGDSTATMDTSDAVFAQPTPLYAPQYYIDDPGNTYGTSAAVVDASKNVTGSVTSGTFVAGEQVKQTTSNATAYLINSVTGSNTMVIGPVTGTATSSPTWVGQTSAAIYTPTAVPVANGNDTNSCAVSEATYNPASPPSPCATINGAAVKMAAFNNATYTRNDVAGTIYLKQGYYQWLGASAAISNTTANVWATITPFNTVTKAQVVIYDQTGLQSFGTQCTSGSTNCGTPIHLKNVTVNVATAPVSVFNNITYLWFDGTSLTSNGTAPLYQNTIVYFTWGQVPSLAGGLYPFGGANTSMALIRGMDLTGGLGQIYWYTMLGNTNTTTTAQLQIINEIPSQTNPASTEPIFAFNTLYKMTPISQAPLTGNYTTGSIIGVAIIQNIFENNYTNESMGMIGLSADSSTATPDNNVMIWHNVLVGGRINRSYNDSGTTALFRQAWSEIGNLQDQDAIKTDTFGTPSANRTGNWALLYGVGRRSSLTAELFGGTTGWPASGNFRQEFPGLNSYDPAQTYNANGTSTTNPITSATNSTINLFNYKNRSAFDGTSANAGSGDYRVLSNSIANYMVPAGTAVLPYDLNGVLRNNSGFGAAGAYEQTAIPQVFSF